MPDSYSAVVRSSRTLRRKLTNWSWFNGETASASPLLSRRASGSIIEPLEDRQLMSVVYLSSSSGKDTNSGTSSAAPVASIAKATKLVKAGDTLLLKSGDSWHQGLGNWSKSGITIASYGTGAKPKIFSSDDGLALIRASNFTIRNLSFNGLAKTDRSGIVTTGANGNITIDSCDIVGYRKNVLLQGYFGPINNVKILNSNISYSNSGGNSSGLYADKVNGLSLVNDIFDHNGGTGSIFNHGAYIVSTCNGFSATGCTFSFNSNCGLQARAGGTITNCLFKSNSVDLMVGIVNGGGVHKDGGVTCNVSNNTFTGAGVGLNSGYGIDVGNIKSGSITNNKFINGPGKKYGYPISLDRGSAAGRQVGVNNLLISGNTGSNWGSHVINISSTAGAHNVTITNNHF